MPFFYKRKNLSGIISTGNFHLNNSWHLIELNALNPFRA